MPRIDINYLELLENTQQIAKLNKKRGILNSEAIGEKLVGSIFHYLWKSSTLNDLGSSHLCMLYANSIQLMAIVVSRTSPLHPSVEF
jgi:hypothetical protein